MKRKYKAKAAVSFLLALCISLTALGQGVSQDVRVTASEAEQNRQGIKESKAKISELEKKQEELDKKISGTKDDISEQKENQKAISEQIDTVSETITALNESIIALDKQIDELTEEIAKQQQAIALKKDEIEQGVKDFGGRLRALYVAGSESYTEILLGATDFYDMLMKIELIKRVASHDSTELDRLIAIKDEYEAQLSVLEKNQAELKKASSELDTQRQKSEEQKQKLAKLYTESEEIIAGLEKAEAAYEKNKEQIVAEQEQYEDELAALYKKEEERKAREAEEAERKRREAEEAERKRLEAEQAAQQQSYEENDTSNASNDSQSDESYSAPVSNSGFMWPVPGQYGITSYMGWRWGAFHKGIDISTWGIRGSAVVASSSGTVIVACNECTHDWPKDGSCGCGGGYGNHVIIDHGNGYWTLYGHMQYASVSVGDHVEQGQKIGAVGTTGWSTGDHCHFEVRLNGNPVDPTQYVSY